MVLELGELRSTYRDLCDAILTNPRTGLPAWSATLAPGDLLKRPIISVATETLEPSISWLDRNANVVGIINDFRLNETFGAHRCLATSQMADLHRENPTAIFINSTVEGDAQNHFNIAAAQSAIPTLSLLHFHRLLRLIDGITIPIRPLGLLEVCDVLSYFDSSIELAADSARVEKHLRDHYSKITLYGLLMYRLTSDSVWHRRVSVGRFMQPFGLDSYIFNQRYFDLSETEFFVDGGAYRGDTLNVFARSVSDAFEKIHAFEPDERNFTYLQQFVADRFGATQTNVKCHQAGIWEKSGRVRFCSLDSGASPATSSHFQYDEDSESIEGVAVVSLDDCLDGEAPSLIKLEIEGSELAALKGARQTIVRHRPKIAVAAYHRPRDLTTLLDCMLELDAGYEFGLAHHRDSISTTVYYCVPS